ncbi:MAG: ATP-dependent RecD-like DNA helicase [Myxococcales bacterium]|nr:ATP-dependent RecD-like DNA helicase [Myxococcales bacterium]
MAGSGGSDGPDGPGAGPDPAAAAPQRSLALATPAAASDAGPGPGAVTLDGELDRIVFRGDDTGFTVARFGIPGHPEPVTVVGNLLGVNEGTPLRLRGTWVMDRKWGRQFKIDTYQTRTPETVIGIERFLGSGAIPGVGPELARRLVAKFGMETLAVIERAPQRLTEVDGIGVMRAGKIASAWADQRHVQDVMVFLRGHGVSAAFAARIVKRYGNDAISTIRKNPYRLAIDIWGIGFKSADAIAQSLGIARDAPERLEAGLVHALGVTIEDGHAHVPEDTLLVAAAELLGVDRERLREPLAALEASRHVVREVLGDRGACISLAEVWTLEHEAAAAFAELVRTPARALTIDVDAAARDFEVATSLELAPQQRAAVVASAVDKCVVVTGGPGVGKTTIVRAIVHLAGLQRRAVALAAPTGRAAKRLGEATGRDALTIHRLLEYQPHEGQFARNQGNPIDADLVVVDEASMIDIALFRALVVALRPDAQLVLVGDIDQLPSVGPGAVLHDVIASRAATVVRLTEIFRQAAQSRIVVNAHRINQGVAPDLDTPPAGDGPLGDFFFVGRDDPAAARDTVVELVAERIPARFGFDRVQDIQVLVPMHRGELGTASLNAALQARLNPARDDAAELRRGDRAFRAGDKVMQLKNDYDKGVFNGDIGVITEVGRGGADGGGPMLRLELGDGRVASYERAELDQLIHAYAVSVHKSQGSEYPAVVIPIATQHYMMLQRSLLYTAVTRGKRLVVLVGSRRAIGMAVRNATARQRWTWLSERIRELDVD